MPAKILEVADIPRTKSGKIVELAVRDVVHGRAVKNREALANPEALELYRDRKELLRVSKSKIHHRDTEAQRERAERARS